MAEEIEIKILEIEPDEIIRRLEVLGAKKIFDGTISAVYYDFPDNRLTGEDKTLRLRTKGENAELTYKEPISKEKMKIMDEYETKVEDPESLRKIFDKVGFVKTFSHRKRRISYGWNGAHFEIDLYEDIPPLLEIEAPSVQLLEECVVKIGFTMRDAKPWSAKDVLSYYKKI